MFSLLGPLEKTLGVAGVAGALAYWMDMRLKPIEVRLETSLSNVEKDIGFLRQDMHAMEARIIAACKK